MEADTTTLAGEARAVCRADTLLDVVVGDWDARDVDLLSAWIAGDHEETSSNDSNASSSLELSSPPSSDAISLPTDRNPTRQRQRQEITYLRTRVDEMEQELATLRSRKVVIPTAEATTAIACEWEAIATRQQKARERAELENTKLRGMLESQLKLARTLERLLRKRDHAASALDCRGTKKRRATTNACVATESDRVVFERLLLGIDHSYAETTAVLTANGLWTAPRGHRRVEIKAHSRQDAEAFHGMTQHDLYVEMTDVTTVPFAIEATAQAAWRCITEGFMQLDHEVYQELAGQDNVLAIKYAIALARRRLHVDFTARAAMKRFVQRDRIVDVWESISDTAGSHVSPSGAQGIRVRELGWTVFASVDGDPTRTLQLTCMQMMPLVSFDISSTASQDRQVGLLTNLALDYYGDQLDHAQHAMENLLLEDARHESAIAQLLPRD